MSKNRQTRPKCRKIVKLVEKALKTAKNFEKVQKVSKTAEKPLKFQKKGKIATKISRNRQNIRQDVEKPSNPSKNR